MDAIQQQQALLTLTVKDLIDLYFFIKSLEEESPLDRIGLGVNELAEHLGISKSTAERLKASKEFSKALKQNGKSWAFDKKLAEDSYKLYKQLKK